MAALYDGEPFRAERPRLRPGPHLRSNRAAGGERRPGRLDATGDAEVGSRILGKILESLHLYGSGALDQGGLVHEEPRARSQGSTRIHWRIRKTKTRGPRCESSPPDRHAEIHTGRKAGDLRYAGLRCDSRSLRSCSWPPPASPPRRPPARPRRASAKEMPPKRLNRGWPSPSGRTSSTPGTCRTT